MIHTLEGFCRWLYPDKDEAQLRASVYWLSSLSFQKQKQKQYRRRSIPKSSGGERLLLIPSHSLKTVQRGVAQLISQGAVSPAATAYRPGVSLRDNAAPHLGQEMVIKLDLQDFFGSITFPKVLDAIDRALALSPLVGRHFYTDLGGNERDRRENRYNDVLSFSFAQFCTFEGSLPQGAPSSPLLSNLVFQPVDQVLLDYCNRHGIRYTRYSDDLTFSGSFSREFSPSRLVGFVRSVTEQNGYRLNQGKTRVLGKGQRHSVTGITANQKLQASAGYRKELRQQCYYLGRFGLESHLNQTGAAEAPNQYLRQLLGRIQFVLQIDPENQEFLSYRKQVLALLSQIERP